MKITRIETAIHPDIRRGLLMLRIHTDAGIIGCGETWYTPHAVAAMIHDWMGRRLLGADPLSLEAHWRFLYERSTSFGSPGCELRALSAVDLAHGFNIPVVMHDCTGPFALIAGVHLATACGNIPWQESVRAHVRKVYPSLVDNIPEIKEGEIVPLEEPGLGSRWKPELFEEGKGIIRVSELA